MSDTIQNVIPVLPWRDLVVFPGVIVPLFVGRDKSVNALETAATLGNNILLVTQKEPGNDSPKTSELHKVGVVGKILQVLKLNDTTLKVLVEGKQRVKVIKYLSEGSHYGALCKPIREVTPRATESCESLRRSITAQFETYVQLDSKANTEAVAAIKSITDIGKFADIVAANVLMKSENKQKVLEATNVLKRLEMLVGYMEVEIEFRNTDKRIKSRIREQIDDNQKQYYLNEHLKAIYKELGDEDYREEVNELAEAAKKLKLTQEAREKVDSELKKLKFTNPMSSESAVIRNYIDWFIKLPWKVYSPLTKDVVKAQGVLDQDHYGLEKVKERIVEYLAVNLRTKSLKSPIICLVGPPGVGKTSLVKSIARATGREFAKVSLGGLRDEAEIRGHRRTYIGAMPGKVLQAMKKVKRSNPVILLDEIDKMGFDHRGDPASALLEVLDPEQNNAFSDHYLEVDYDLSQVLFVATANSYDGIPRPLLDRMEIIRLSGYTELEKLAIARNYLVPKQLEAHGAKKKEVVFGDEGLLHIIRYYTREAGVRGLERSIAKVIRKAIKEVMLDKKDECMDITPANLGHYLGVAKYQLGEIEKDDMVGVTNGLAYTEVGGELLSIEAVLLYGKGGDLKITGKLGDVMKESVQAALSYIRSRAPEFGINPNVFKYKDLHIHFPEGATPKDGPSAGIAISTSLVSVLTGIPVKRDVAMTGEITLRGRVLPIGGLKEKLLAALRGGVKTVLIPFENVKDLEEIPNNIKDGLEIVPVERVEEVFNRALVGPFRPIKWDDLKAFNEQVCQLEGAIRH